MQRCRAIPQIAAVAVLLSLLLTACRVPEAPATVYPGVDSYPSPRPAVTTRAPTAAKPTVPTVVPTVAPSATTAPPVSPGEVAFSLTILHSGEVAGEVVPCG